MRLIIFVLLFTVLPMFAHPPKDIELVYDSDSCILRADVIHDVNDPSKHYIIEVNVELNGKQIIDQTFKSQVDNDKQQARYMIIDAKDGDKLAVEAHCNITGKKKVQLEVTKPKGN